MKKMTKVLALVLALAMILSLAACSKSNGIAGTWKYTVDFQKAMEASGGMEGMDEMAAEMGDSFTQLFEGLTMTVILDLKDDNTYTFQVDEASAKAAAEGMMSRMGDILPSLLSAMLGVEADQLDETLKGMGTSMDEMLAEMEGSMDTDELVKQLQEEAQKGTYRYEDGKLYLTPEGETENAEKYLTVELGNELKVTAINGVEGMDDYEAMLPMVFVR